MDPSTMTNHDLQHWTGVDMDQSTMTYSSSQIHANPASVIQQAVDLFVKHASLWTPLRPRLQSTYMQLPALYSCKPLVQLVELTVRSI